MRWIDENVEVHELSDYVRPIAPKVLALQRELDNIHMTWLDAQNAFKVRRRVWWKPWTWFRRSVYLAAPGTDARKGE